MTEIQGKSILVRVSARFDLARVRVIGSQLYISEATQQDGRANKMANLCDDPGIIEGPEHSLC